MPSREEWLAWRRGDGTTLGATDCAAIACAAIGWPSFRSPADLYEAHWHPPTKAEDRLSPALARMEVGLRLEGYVLERAMRDHGLPQPTPGPWLTIEPHPWWRGSLDSPPIAIDGHTFVVDAKTCDYRSAGHYVDASGAPCWPPVYLCQLAQYAVGLILNGVPVDGVMLAVLDIGTQEQFYRRALLDDPITVHLSAEYAAFVDDDGQPITVRRLGEVCIHLGAQFRSTYLLGDEAPEPPVGGDVVSWWASRPRPAKSSRPATEREVADLAEYAAALRDQRRAGERKDLARDAIARSMTEGSPVARIFAPGASASISANGKLTITTSKESA